MITHPEAQRWNSRYQAEQLLWLSRPPKQFLVDFIDILPRQGLALDAAAGVATNGLLLAQRGLQVIALDISWVALEMARQRFRNHGLSLATAVYDLRFLWLPTESFEVILNFNFAERSTFPIYRRALKPGGLIFIQCFIQNDSHLTPEHCLNPGELSDTFHDFEIIHFKQEGLTNPDGACHKTIEQLVARKPNKLKI